MTTEQQMTFGETVGLESFVPTQILGDDLVECSDGTIVSHCEAFYDCKNSPHSSDEDRELADIQIVENILDAHVKWAEEYATENDDYTSGYDHIVSEESPSWPRYVEEWIRDEYHDRMGHGPYDDCMGDLVHEVCYDIGARDIDAEWEYNNNEYAAYSGSGCCLWGFDIGECEEQVDVTCVPEFEALHNDGRLRDILDVVNCDAYVSTSVGSLSGDYPVFEFYHTPGGRWDCVVSKERMAEHVTAAIILLCRKAV